MPPRTFVLWAVLALAVGGVFLLGYAWQARRRRQQRLASWTELCRRLELVPRPGKGRAASGKLQDTDFSLHDLGSRWLLELPLSQPLLPPGVVLLSERAGRLRPPFRLRPLRWASASTPPGGLRWYAAGSMPPSTVEAPAAFLEEAERAAQAHAPLRVEPQRLVQALSAGSLLSVNDVREAVRALEATARRWLEAVGVQGLPRLEALPYRPSAFSLLRGVLAQRALWSWPLILNAGLPLTLGALWKGWGWAFYLMLGVGLIVALSSSAVRRYGFRSVLLGAMVLVSTFVAPSYFTRIQAGSTSPSVLWLRYAADRDHRKAEYFRFHDGTFRRDLMSPETGSLIPVLPKHWRQGDPIAVWAVRPPPADAKAETLGAISRDPRHRHRHREAIILRALKQNLPIRPAPIFLDFSTHPDEVEAGLRRKALLIWGLPHALWLGGVLVMWGGAIRSSRRAREG